jgi:hypothetical protein
MWLTQYDRGDLNEDVAAASVVADYEAKIAALEDKGRAAEDGNRSA